MKIICNATGSERKRMAEVLGAHLLMEPIYKKAPTFAYVVSDYTIDKNGTIFCPVSATVEDVARIVAKLEDEGFTTEVEGIESVEDDDPVSDDEFTEDEAPAKTPAETPDVAPEAEPEGMPEDEATEADMGAETPDVAAPEAETSDEADQPDEATADADDNKLTVSIPRAKLPNDALDRLRTIVANKEDLFKRALLTDALPIEVTDEEISFPWFTLTRIDGEAAAYTQFITALCQMAVEQKRVLDKPYDGDNDRFTMRIFMVRLGMKGSEFALARKLMMKHLTGNSGWRYEESANKTERSNPNRSAVQHLKKVYPTNTRVELIPMSDESVAEIKIGTHGAVIGVDENGSVFIKLDNGSAFGIAFCVNEPETEADQPDATGSAEPETTESISPEVTGDFEPDAPFGLPEGIDSEVPFENEPDEEVSE